MYYGHWRYKNVLWLLTLYVYTTAIDAITMYYGYWRYKYINVIIMYYGHWRYKYVLRLLTL